MKDDGTRFGIRPGTVYGRCAGSRVLNPKRKLGLRTRKIIRVEV